MKVWNWFEHFLRRRRGAKFILKDYSVDITIPIKGTPGSVLDLLPSVDSIASPLPQEALQIAIAKAEGKG